MPNIDANGNLVYSQAEYEHLNFMGEPFCGFVEGIGYTCTDTIVVPVPMNRSNTERMYSIQKLQISFSIPNWVNSNSFSAPITNKPEKQTNSNQTKTQEAAQKEAQTNQSQPPIKSIKEKIGDFLMSLAKSKINEQALTGALIVGGSQALADKVIPHSWADSPKTPALIADLIVTSEFFTGTGPESRFFGPEMSSTRSLMNSHLTHIGYNKYLNATNNLIKNIPDTTISVGFNPLERTDSGPFTEAFWDQNYNTAQFVGSADFIFHLDGNTIEITITNTTSIKSAFYHIPGLPKPSRNETPCGVMGNVDQAYRYKISKEDILKKGRTTRWFTNSKYD